jgi:HD-like signal output (HDOD) protein
MMLATPMTTTDDVLSQIDSARRNGPLRDIVIPACPALLTRLQEAMAHAEPDLNEVARIATADVAMSATLLANANSPRYAAGQPVQTLGQAMNRLGLHEAAAVMMRFLAQRTIRVTTPQLSRFWERAAKRAATMGFLAEKLPGLSPDLAYTYGLFCHVGLPVMAQSLPGYKSTLVEAEARVDRSFVATENANHRADHAVVGALVARVWRLAPAVIAAIRLHHDLDALGERAVDAEVNTLIAVGLVAQYMVNRNECIDPDVDWRNHGAAALGWLHVQADELALWEEEAQELLDEAVGA